jgi:hypothetical protein
MRDKKEKYKPFKSALISLSLTLFVCWYLFESTTGEGITLVETRGNNIVVQDNDSHKILIKTNVDISQIIKIDEVYDVEYKKRFLQTPRLISITPVKNY